MKRLFLPVFLLAMMVSIMAAQAQLSMRVPPPSTVYGLVLPETGNRTLLPAPDPNALALEDQANPSPYRYAVLLPTALTTDRQGAWTEVPGGRIWRAEVASPGAFALAAYFDRFFLRPGEQLFIYPPDKSRTLGAFTERNNKPEGTFATALLPGDRMVVEFFQPTGITGLPMIRINEVAYAYRGVPDPAILRSAGDCEVNAVCPEGAGWQEEKQGIVRISIKKLSALYWCSGSLLNNTRLDKTPYVLTADHCGTMATTNDLTQWVFYFNYETPACNYPGLIFPDESMTGAKIRAHGGDSGDDGSDFYLVILTESIPDSFDVYLNGWSRKDTAATHGVGIHHPQGDVKKISTFTGPLETSTYMGGPVLSHWKVIWSPTVSGHGVTEGGSSGSPIFNELGLIVGTLTGGFSMCDTGSLDSPDYYGKFSYSWDSNGADSTKRLDHWLDPDNTGLMTLPGIALDVQRLQQEFSMTVYPNPFSGNFRLSIPALADDCLIRIHDLLGGLRYSMEIPSGSAMPVTVTPSISPGIYLLSIMTDKQTITRKIIKIN